MQQSWVMCPAGKAALQIDDGEIVHEPIDGDEAGSFVPNGWLVEGFNTGTADLIVRPWVVCATVD